MFPIHDENPTKITPYITYILIIINVLVFLHEVRLMNYSSDRLEYFFRLYAVVPRELTASFQGVNLNQSVPEWITLFSSQFLHGSWLHLGGNMLFLWIFGNNIEEQLGRFKYILFYLTCGALAALTQWFFSVNSNIPALGASGAIAGVMGAYIIRFPKTKILTLIPIGIIIPIKIPAYFFLGVWFLQQALYSILSLDVPSNIEVETGGIAYWAHAGGFVFGAILAPLLGLFSKKDRHH